MPRAAGFRRSTTFRGVVPDSEKLVRRLVAVSDLAGSHRRIAGAIKDGGDCLLLQITRATPFLHRERGGRQMPDSPSVMIICRDGVQTAPMLAPM